MFDLGGPAMGLSNRGRRNERLLRGDEDDEYDENPKGILSLLEENARLRRLRIKQSSMILKSVAEQIAKFIALDVAGQDTTMAKTRADGIPRDAGLQDYRASIVKTIERIDTGSA
jgi:hypothetical protein